MSEAELHGLINSLYETAQGMVDFWISVTFAVILARFFGARVLSKKVLQTVTGLYALATVLSIARWGIGVLVVVLYLLGTWATMSFLIGRWAPTES